MSRKATCPTLPWWQKHFGINGAEEYSRYQLLFGELEAQAHTIKQPFSSDYASSLQVLLP